MSLREGGPERCNLIDSVLSVVIFLNFDSRVANLRSVLVCHRGQCPPSKMTPSCPSTHPSLWPRRRRRTPSSTGQPPNVRLSTKTAVAAAVSQQRHGRHRRLPEAAASDFVRSSGPYRRSCCTRRSRATTLSARITTKTGMYQNQWTSIPPTLVDM